MDNYKCNLCNKKYSRPKELEIRKIYGIKNTKYGNVLVGNLNHLDECNKFVCTNCLFNNK